MTAAPLLTEASHHGIARTGRVQNWLDDPSDSLPVSCTVFNVADSMWGHNGIVDSYAFATNALQKGAGCAIHLSDLRPNGTENSRGMVASGPCSFIPVYSSINYAVRRGNKYKNGAIVIHLDIDHADIEEYIDMDRNQIGWVKRCVDVDQPKWDAASPQVKQKIIAGLAAGDIWLSKITYDPWGNRLRFNVCLEIKLLSRGTCLLQHLNLGNLEIDEIDEAFAKGMEELVTLHPKTGVGEGGFYLEPSEDKQVGLGLLGLANLLAIEKVSYAELADALEDHINYGYFGDTTLHQGTSHTARRIVESIANGIARASVIARKAGMQRAFTIAPTASCSYRYKDRAGFTTAPEIAPPIGREVERDSSTFGITTHSYGDVETAEQVGWETFLRVANGIVTLMTASGLFHGYSLNHWSDLVSYDEQFVEDWLQSPQTSLYYALQVRENRQAKDNAMVALEDSTDFKEMFDFGCVSCAE